ncbi:MAG: FAD-binding oxidoreductase [Devosiaceae bacterium]|nr:FAD-binding oxidoreductase [Devosiaceae bacterium MH13]
MTDRPPLEGQTIAVLGAGMVGVCTALELQKRGARVTLVDRSGPGTMTSYGNAGVLARSSLIPANNPSLLFNLPRLARNTSAALRYEPRFVWRNAPWLIQFLTSIRRSKFLETVEALDGLIRLSIEEHTRLVEANGLQSHLSDHGWLFLYRKARAYRRARSHRRLMRGYGIGLQDLSRADLSDLEPDLEPIFENAVWVKDSYSVNNPGAVVEGYARAFVNAGGQIETQSVQGLREHEGHVTLHLAGRNDLRADQVVVALGPWAKSFLSDAGYRVRMAFERGYHRHFSGGAQRGHNAQLTRPVFDTSGGYVLAPMEAGLRLSTGVELADDEAPQTTRQIEQAEQAAREAIDLGERLDDEPWMGSRPSLPDSRPAIGLAPGSKRVYLGIGHQHIGFTTGAGTAQVLADLMSNRPCPIDPTPFRTDRYIKRVA